MQNALESDSSVYCRGRLLSPEEVMALEDNALVWIMYRPPDDSLRVFVHYTPYPVNGAHRITRVRRPPAEGNPSGWAYTDGKRGTTREFYPEDVGRGTWIYQALLKSTDEKR